MAAPKRPTHIIDHPRYYGQTDKNGKLKRTEKGTPAILTDEAAKKHGRLVRPLESAQAVDLTAAVVPTGAQTDGGNAQ